MIKFLLIIVFAGVMFHPFHIYYIYILTILLIIISVATWLFLYGGLGFLKKSRPIYLIFKKNPTKWASKDFSYKSSEGEVDKALIAILIGGFISLKISILAYHYWEKLDTLLLIASFIGILPIITPLILSIFFTFKYWGEDDD